MCESRCSESISAVRGPTVLTNFAIEKMRRNDTPQVGEAGGEEKSQVHEIEWIWELNKVTATHLR